MKIPAIGTCIHVVWLDTTTTSGWNYLEAGMRTPAEPRRIETYGKLTGHSAVAITISPTISQEGGKGEGHLDPITIPLGCIVEIRSFPCG